MRDGSFALDAETKIVCDAASEPMARLLAERLWKSTGFPIRIEPGDLAQDVQNSIVLTTKFADEKLGAEGYQLTVTPERAVIEAPTEAGVFYGAQTFLQLLPPEIFSPKKTSAEWTAPCVEIRDWPRFAWRGLMLDVSRHFYDKAEVERVLDEMALHKLNTFHWHLTDDQGWRIEIKKYPKLTEVGAWRSRSELNPAGVAANPAENAHPAWAEDAPSKFGPDHRYGGFYTQDDIREVVDYAAARHITIVPEIEMPGHATAALAAYPGFSCDSTAKYTTDVNAGVLAGVFDPSNPAAIEFLENVLDEVFALFPGKFVHVGGDEVSDEVKKETWEKSPQCQALMKREGLKNSAELQNWFTRQIEKYVRSKGKRLIGWTEIAEGGGMPRDAAIMDWVGGGLEAASSGRDVVMSPTDFCYLDYYQSKDHATEPRAIGGYVPLEKVYQFEPVPAKLAAENEPYLLGGQCNLWTEYVRSLPHVEYMYFPRACALAEVGWSAKPDRDFDDFSRRLAVHEKRLDQLGINYRHEPAPKSAD